MGVCLGRLGEGKDFFFEKKKQKTFVGLSRTRLTKVFWSFFSKKDCLPCLAPQPVMVSLAKRPAHS
jgi:hypothetical protein